MLQIQNYVRISSMKSHRILNILVRKSNTIKTGKPYQTVSRKIFKNKIKFILNYFDIRF